MSLWQIGLYAAATFLALRSLVALMEHHRRHYRQELIRKDLENELQRRAAETARSKPSKGNGKAA